MLVAQLGCIFYCFWGGPNSDSMRKWENASLAVTIIYTLVVYIFVLWKPNKLQTIQRACAVTICGLVIVTIILIVAKEADLIEINATIDRQEKMWAIWLGAAAFLIINVIMLKAGENRIALKKNLFFSDIPVCTTFFVLALYATKIGVNTMPSPIKETWDAFFAGAVAFQMISSNVIWAFNDDELFKN